MPFTPFHFGPHACIGLSFQQYLDLPLFIGVNVVVDIEPLMVMIFNPNYPLHGYMHTFVFSSALGIVCAILAFPFRRVIRRAMSMLRLGYRASLKWMIVSAVCGAWLHVLLDSFLYYDIKPFFPLLNNPLLNHVSEGQIYLGCLLSLLPAAVLYCRQVVRKKVA